MLRRPVIIIAKGLGSQRFRTKPIISTIITQQQQQQHHNGITRYFSTDGGDNTKTDKNQESLRDTINRMKANSKSKDNNSNQESDSTTNDIFHKIRDSIDQFREGVVQTWNELLDSNKPKGINKKIRVDNANSEDGPRAAPAYDGPVGLVVIDEKETMGAWEKMQRRLAGAPVIAGILSRSHEIYEQSGAKAAREKINDIRHDAQEAWETSQNPWVYRVSSVYDTLTAESEEAAALRQLRVLDPDFSLEQFKHDAKEHTLPLIMGYFLRGEIENLESWLGEAVYRRLSAEMATRRKEGVILDANILSIFNVEILETPMDKLTREPVLLMHFMCQQINCARNEKTGEIVEGSEDDVKAHSYLMCFQREYDEEEGSLNWKVIDFRPNGAIAWI